MSLHRVWLAGVKHHDAKLIAEPIPEGALLELKADPGNPHDPKAVGVHISAEAMRTAGMHDTALPRGIEAFQLGYLPAARGPNYAAMVAAILGSGGAVVAKMRRHQENGQIRITIESPDLPSDGAQPQ